MKSYINVYQTRAGICHKYIENGKRKFEIVKFRPIYGYHTNEPSDWHDIYGKPLKTIRFNSMAEAREWKNQQEGTIAVYGDINHTSAFIAQNYINDIKAQKEFMNIYNLDIEVWSDSGFPKASNPKNFINAITFQNMYTKHFYVFSLKDYTSKDEKVHYYKCNSEINLLEQIIDFVNRQDIDIFSGYNIVAFDIPYIIDRITLLLGEEEAKRLSPNKSISKDTKIVNKREVSVYDIKGIIMYDYLDLIQKFTYETLESYSLDYVAKHFLGKEKLKYKEEYGDLNTLYEQNFEKYIEYNILDVQLVDELDMKLKFIDIAINYAYSMKCTLQIIWGTIQPWDSLLYSILFKEKILCPPNKVGKSPEDFLGGYVKDPIQGMHKWVSIFDIVSSYPSQIIQYNISNETILSEYEVNKNPELKELREQYTGIDKCIDVNALEKITSILKKHNVTFTSNGYFFKLDKQGFISQIVEKFFNDRMEMKKELANLNQEKENLLSLLK